MNREIKFRAWDSHNKVMKYYTLKQLADFDQFNADTEYEAIQSGFDNWKWMQYIGLKDKNNKEIYDGDIYKTWYSRDTTGNSIVLFNEQVEFQSTKESSGFEIVFIENAEVIGNIYENPNLLV